MTTPTIYLDKERVKDRIASNYGSTHGHGWCYTLIVTPEGNHRITPVQANRNWNPWNPNDYHAPLPAPYGDGSGALEELAQDMFRDLDQLDEAKRHAEAEDRSLVDLAEDTQDWEYWLDEALDWYANEWLNAINGETNDLQGWDAPWGHKGNVYEGNLETIQPPFKFEYKRE